MSCTPSLDIDPMVLVEGGLEMSNYSTSSLGGHEHHDSECRLPNNLIPRWHFS